MNQDGEISKTPKDERITTLEMLDARLDEAVAENDANLAESLRYCLGEMQEIGRRITALRGVEGINLEFLIPQQPEELGEACVIQHNALISALRPLKDALNNTGRQGKLDIDRGERWKLRNTLLEIETDISAYSGRAEIRGFSQERNEVCADLISRAVIDETDMGGFDFPTYAEKYRLDATEQIGLLWTRVRDLEIMGLERHDPRLTHQARLLKKFIEKHGTEAIPSIA